MLFIVFATKITLQAVRQIVLLHEKLLKSNFIQVATTFGTPSWQYCADDITPLKLCLIWLN